MLWDFGPFYIDGARGLAIFDYESDGDLDIVSASLRYEASSIYIMENDGLGSFRHLISASGLAPYSNGIDAFDADGDGDHDLLFATAEPPWSPLTYVENHTYVENRGSYLEPGRVLDLLTSIPSAVGCPPLDDAPVQHAPASVWPSSGTGSKQSFQFRFSTANGSMVTGASILIGEGFTKRNSCWIHFELTSGRIFLADDDLRPWFARGSATPEISATASVRCC